MSIPKQTKTTEVDLYMQKLEYPFKQEIEVLREIIKNTDSRIKEEIKWSAPSFSFTDYICTFNLRDQEKIHLIFHNPNISKIKNKILEGDYKDRRMVYFLNIKDIKEKKKDLENVIKELVKLME